MRGAFIILTILSGLGAGSGCREEVAPETPSKRLEVTTADAQELQERTRDSEADVVMVHLWATWCLPCREEFPELVQLADHPQASRFEVILLSADPAGKEEQVRSFLQEQNSPWGSLIAESLGEDLFGTLSPDWSGAIPATFFFDANGKLLDWWEGARPLDEYDNTIRKLLSDNT
mgnify:CR=1 FL=1